MSRDDARDDSDVDLLVTLAPGTSALALGRLLLDAQELPGRRVDVVTEASLHPALRDRVLADTVVLRHPRPTPAVYCWRTCRSAWHASWSTPVASAHASKVRA